MYRLHVAIDNNIVDQLSQNDGRCMPLMLAGVIYLHGIDRGLLWTILLLLQWLPNSTTSQFQVQLWTN